MDLSNKSNLIAGGIDVVGGFIKCGGQERVVGENTKWNMRNKFLKLKHLSKSPTIDDKSLLKIVSLKLPLTFNRNLNFYDDDKNPMPSKTEKTSSCDIHDKAIEVLEERLNDKTCAIVKRLTTEYNLRAPLFWVLSDTVKFLAVTQRKKNPTARKVKISPEMAALIENIWKGKDYFQYVVNSDDVPSNMMDLMLNMLEVIEKGNPPRGEWAEPKLEILKHPCWCSVLKTEVEKAIDDEKKKLVKKIKGMKGIDIVKEYIFTILTIENLLIDFLDRVEQYYIHQAKNMSKIFDSLKKFFKKK